MQVSTAEFKKGLKIQFDGEPYSIVDFQHVKPGKGGAFVRTKLKHMRLGRVIDNTFRAGEKVELVDFEEKRMQYLYRDDRYHFMDLETYDQIALSADERSVALASLETALRLGADSVTNRQTCIALHIESGNGARAVQLLQGSAARGLAFPLVDQTLEWLANENEWESFRALSAFVDRAALGAVEQSRLLTRRARLAVRDGNRRAARTALEEAVALDPANADALMALGGALEAGFDRAARAERARLLEQAGLAEAARFEQR